MFYLYIYIYALENANVSCDGHERITFQFGPGDLTAVNDDSVCAVDRKNSTIPSRHMVFICNGIVRPYAWRRIVRRCLCMTGGVSIPYFTREREREKTRAVLERRTSGGRDGEIFQFHRLLVRDERQYEKTRCVPTERSLTATGANWKTHLN